MCPKKKIQKNQVLTHVCISVYNMLLNYRKYIGYSISGGLDKKKKIHLTMFGENFSFEILR